MWLMSKETGKMCLYNAKGCRAVNMIAKNAISDCYSHASQLYCF